MDLNDIVLLTQEPVIEQHLKEASAFIADRVAEAKSLEPTAETLSACRSYRADFNRLRTSWENGRKQVKEQVMAPYLAFEKLYKELILDPLDDADAVMKGKITEVEDTLKSECEQKLRAWFEELKQAQGVPWLTWEQLGIKVDMASARAKRPARLIKAIEEKVSAIRADYTAASGMKNAPEIMAEYRETLNLGESISTVLKRSARVAATAEDLERDRAAALEEEQREAELQSAFAPAEEADTMEVTFTVTDTRKRLIALREWMKANGYQYT